MNKKLNWGILGGGKITKKIIPAMLNAENAGLCAVASVSGVDPEFVKQYGELKIYSNYEDLISDPNIDCVYIALATGIHYEWTVKAIRNNKHVLCEKPMALNTNQIIQIMTESKKAGVCVAEAFAYLYSPVIGKVKQLISGGKIGAIKYIHSMFSTTISDVGDFRHDPDMGGGALYDVGCYPISFITEIIGEYPIEIGAYTNISQNGIDTGTVASFRFNDGVLASCYYSFDGFLKRNSHTIIGSLGVIEIDAAFNQEGICKITLTSEAGIETISVDCPNNYTLEIQAFGEAVLNDVPLITDLEFSMKNASVIENVLAKGGVLRLLTPKSTHV